MARSCSSKTDISSNTRLMRIYSKHFTFLFFNEEPVRIFLKVVF